MVPTYVHVLDSFKAESPEQLSLKKGTYVRVLRSSEDGEDYFGEVGVGAKNCGWFACYYVEMVDEADLPRKVRDKFKKLDKAKEKSGARSRSASRGTGDTPPSVSVQGLKPLSPRRGTPKDKEQEDGHASLSLSSRKIRKSSKGNRSPRGDKHEVQITHASNPEGAQNLLHRKQEEGDTIFKRSRLDAVEYAKLYSGPTFGVPLAHLMYIGYNEYVIPPILEKTLAFLLKHTELEGIFRVSGDADTINTWKAKFNAGEPVSFTKECNPHNVSGLLKAWLRELPEPLLTYQMTEEWVEFSATPDTPEKLDECRHKLESLPILNREVLAELFSFLYILSRSAKKNLMGPENIGIVIGPNILQTKSDSPFEHARIMPCGSALASYFVENYASLFTAVISPMSPK